jgi:hypothetical protein
MSRHHFSKHYPVGDSDGPVHHLTHSLLPQQLSDATAAIRAPAGFLGAIRTWCGHEPKVGFLAYILAAAISLVKGPRSDGERGRNRTFNLLIKSYVSRCGCTLDNCSRHNNLTIARPAWTVFEKRWESWRNRTTSNCEGHKKDTASTPIVLTATDHFSPAVGRSP